jgi:ferritin
LYITESVNQLAGLANSGNDFATLNFVNWFVTEQVEEVSTVTTIIENFKMIGDNTSAMFMLDRELGARQPAQ